MDLLKISQVNLETFQWDKKGDTRPYKLDLIPKPKCFNYIRTGLFRTTYEMLLRNNCCR